MSDFNLFSTVENSMTSAIQSSISSMSAGWAGTMVELIGASVALYITCIGYLVISGKIQEPINELIWKLAAILMVIVFVDNANGWISQVNGAVTSLKDALTQSGSAMQTLDEFIQKMIGEGKKLYDAADWYELIYIIPAFWAGVILVALAAFLAMLLNTLSMILVLAFTPIAIASLAFPQTKGTFANWLQLCLSNMFTIMFIAIIFKGIEGITTMMQGQNMSNRALYAVAMIILGLTAAKFVSLAVELGKALASVSVDSAKAAISTQRSVNNANIIPVRSTPKPAPAPAPTPAPAPNPK